jgi:hypothetical protein
MLIKAELPSCRLLYADAHMEVANSRVAVWRVGRVGRVGRGRLGGGGSVGRN